MPSLLEILDDPNYVNANAATKQAIFDKYSAQEPNFTDANDATKNAIRQKFGLVGQQEEEQKVTPQTGFVPQLKRSALSLGSLATDVAPAMVAKAFGNDEYAEKKMQEAGKYQKELAQRFPEEVASYKDITGVGSALTYAKEAFAAAIPSMIPSLLTGGAFGIASRGAMVAAEQAAKSAVLKAAERGLTGKALEEAATKAGLKAAQRTALAYDATGALVGSAAQNIPDTFQQIYDETGKMDLGAALAFGTLNSALDAVVPFNILRKATRSGLTPEQIGAAWYKRAGKGAATGFVSEGSTEALQELGTAAAVKFVDQNKDIFTEKNFEKFINAGLKGGLGGAGITSTTDTVFGKGPDTKSYRPPDENTNKKTVFDQLAGEEDVGQVITPPSGKSNGMASPPSTNVPPAGPNGPNGGGVVSSGQTVNPANGGERVQPDTLGPNVQDFSDADLADIQTARDDMISLKEGYNDTRQKYLELRALGDKATPAQIGMRQRLAQDMAAMLRDNSDVLYKAAEVSGIKPIYEGKGKSRVNRLTQQITDPAFNWAPVFDAATGSQPRAAQDLFGSSATPLQAGRFLRDAGGDPQKALQLIEEEKQKYERDLDRGDEGFFNTAWALRQARPGRNLGEVFKNRRAVAEEWLADKRQSLDDAASEIKRKTSEPRAMQDELFDQTGPSDTGPIKPVQGSQETFADLTDEGNALNATQLEVKRLSAEIEARNKKRGPRTNQVQTLGDDERVSVLEGRINELSTRINNATAELRQLEAARDRPYVSGEQGGRPTTEQIKAQDTLVASYARELTNVQKELADTQARIASGQGIAASEKLAPKVTKTPEQQAEVDTQTTLMPNEEMPAISSQSEAVVQKNQETGQTEVAYKPSRRQKQIADVMSMVRERLGMKSDTGNPDIDFGPGKETSQMDPKTWKATSLEPEETKPPAPVDQKGPPVRGPERAEDEVDHISATTEAETIVSFFNAIKLESDTEEQQTRHKQQKNNVAKQMLEYDIIGADEKSSPGIQFMLSYLSNSVGGLQNLLDFIAALEVSTPFQQSKLFDKAGFPNLSSRRGMETFSNEVQEYISQLGGENLGFDSKIPDNNKYSEVVSSLVSQARVYSPTADGKPREPEVVEQEQKRMVADSKLRAALRNIKQKLDNGIKLSDDEQAVYTYLNNLHYSSFGDALKAAAYDLAYYNLLGGKTNNKNPFTEGYASFGEGGEQARLFKEWLQKNTTRKPEEGRPAFSFTPSSAFNALVKEHQESFEAQLTYEAAYQDYTEKDNALRDTLKKNNIAVAPKTTKATAKKRRKQEAKDIDAEAVYTAEDMPEFVELNLKGLPKVVKLTELQAAISPRPSIVDALKRGHLGEALKMMADMDGHPYYSELAQRLIDTNFTASSRFIKAGTIESLSNDPSVMDNLKQRLSVLQDLITSVLPADQQTSLLEGLRSNDFREVGSALASVNYIMQTKDLPETSRQVVKGANDLWLKQFAWKGKYDPATDTVVMREGNLTNHLLLHESVHAAALHLLDNFENLNDIQRQGYERLDELYKFAKQKMAKLEQDEGKIYGLQDIHEFLSEALTNPQFMARLRNIRYKLSPFSLANRFTESIRKMFNIKKDSTTSNVLNEVIFAADAMMAGTMDLAGLQVASTPKAMSTYTHVKTQRFKHVPQGMPNQKNMVGRMMHSKRFDIREWRSMNAAMRPVYLGVLTMRMIQDIVGGRIKGVDTFVETAEKYLSAKNNILTKSGEISERAAEFQSKNPEMARTLGRVMHGATLLELDPDPAPRAKRFTEVMTAAQRANPNFKELQNDWESLTPEAQNLYRDIRDFYSDMYRQYKSIMHRRIDQLSMLGISAPRILEIRQQFEKGLIKGPYFPLIRYGKYWYELGHKKNTKRYYMFESEAAMFAHMSEEISKDPTLEETVISGNDYKQQMDLNARQSSFLADLFDAVDSADVLMLDSGEIDKTKQDMKDAFYQSYLQHQPDRSIRSKFVHRQGKAGYSEDWVRNFGTMSFTMAYQLSRLDYSEDLRKSLSQARDQIKGRKDASGKKSEQLMSENNALIDYVKELEKGLGDMMSPRDMGKWTTRFSNFGFIYYLSSIGSAAANIMGGVMTGLPTLAGQYAKKGDNYVSAYGKAAFQMGKAFSQLAFTGVSWDKGLLAPSLNRSNGLTDDEKTAYNKFVADGLIDITATYDQSGLASSPTTSYNGMSNKGMRAITWAFHNAERINREMVAMGAFRIAMGKYNDFNKAYAEAKDATHRSMFDYSSINKARVLRNPIAKIALQFKQFPLNMTWYIGMNFRNAYLNSDLSVAEKREARARFVGIMGTSAIFSGVTGMFGWSFFSKVMEALLGDDDDEEPFDFDIAFMTWVTKFAGHDLGIAIARGIPNAFGIDFHSRLKLDGMWIPDGKKNLDEEEALTQFFVALLGPTPGLAITAGRAVDLYNKGLTMRAVEALMPAFIKQPMVAYRYSQEGAQSIHGDIMREPEDITPFQLTMQAIGLRPAEIAEIQTRNIKEKAQEQVIMKEHDRILDLYGLTFLANDTDGNEAAFDKIAAFNEKHPTYVIDIDTLLRSIEKRLDKRAQTENGLYINPKLRHLVGTDYTERDYDSIDPMTMTSNRQLNEMDPFYQR